MTIAPYTHLLADALPLEGRVRIADVGANPIEPPAYQPLLMAGLAEVWGFEPGDEAFDALMKNPPVGAHYVKAAIGVPGPAILNVYPAGEMSSIFKLSKDALYYLGHFRRHYGAETEISVNLRTLDDLSAVPPLDMLKVDVQGADRDVIAGASEKLADAVAVVAEMRFYQFYEDEPSLGDLDAELRAQGFVLHKFMHQKARMLGHSQRDYVNADAMGSQLIDGDAVYIRSMEHRGAWDNRALSVLALLASQVFESHDLALVCMDTLANRGAIDKSLLADYVAALPPEFRKTEVAA